MGAYFLSEKVVFLTDPTSGVSYIELDRLWIENTRLFFAPENTEKARILMELLKRDKHVHMRHNYTIRSLYGHIMIKKHQLYNETETKGCYICTSSNRENIGICTRLWT